MNKWEYKKEHNLEYEELNDVGKDGWELVSVIRYENSVFKPYTNYKYFFKRLINE